MTHGVDAAVEAVQASRADAPRQSALVDPNLSKLHHGDNSMLPSGDSSQPSVRGVAFLSHTESKSTRP